MEDCIFCKIIKGEIPCHKIWEDDKHLAFLSIFPNTPGFSVVTTKKHYASYAFDLPETVLKELCAASAKVGKLLDKAFDDVGRTAMIFEGMGVNHVHSKLFPLHGTGDMGEWKAVHSKINTFFERYPGYVISNDSVRASDKELADLAKKIHEQS